MSCKCSPIVVCDECILQEERGWEDEVDKGKSNARAFNVEWDEAVLKNLKIGWALLTIPFVLLALAFAYAYEGVKRCFS